MPPEELRHEVRGLGPAMCDCNERTHTHTLTGERRRVRERVDADGPHEGRAWLNGCRGAPSEVRHRCAARHTVGLSTYTPDGDVCARKRGRTFGGTSVNACGHWRRKSGRIRGGKGVGRHVCAHFRGCPRKCMACEGNEMAKDAEGKNGKKSKEEDLADRRRHQAMRHRGMRRDDKRPSSGDGGGGCPSFTCTAARCEGLCGRGRWVPLRCLDRRHG